MPLYWGFGMLSSLYEVAIISLGSYFFLTHDLSNYYYNIDITRK